MAITYTSLLHPRIQIAVAGGIRKAVNMANTNGLAGQVTLENKIECFYSKRFGLLFFKNGQDITKAMVKALRAY